MARTRTLTELIAEVRDRADIEGSTHITDAQITRYINQSCAALHSILVQVDEEYFTTATTATTPAPASGHTKVSLVADFYKLRSFSLVIGGRFEVLERYNYERFPELAGLGVANGESGPPYFYRVTATEVDISPGPPEGTSYTIIYVRTFSDMTAGSDTFDGRDGWEEWVVLDAAIKCLNKEESDPSSLMAERERVETRIRSQMQTRDMSRADRVADHAPDADGWSQEIRAGRMV